MTNWEFFKSLKQLCASPTRSKGAALYKFIRFQSDFGNMLCPITAVCFLETGKYYRTSDVHWAAEEIGISAALATDIIYAADNNTGYNVRRIRLQRLMLKACLQEAKT